MFGEPTRVVRITHTVAWDHARGRWSYAIPALSVEATGATLVECVASAWTAAALARAGLPTWLTILTSGHVLGDEIAPPGDR